MAKTSYSKRGIVALCALVYFTSYFSRKSFAAVMAGMLEWGEFADVGGKTVAGLIGTALFIFYGAGQLLSGFLGDKIKPAYLLSLGLFVSALCNLLMPLVPNPLLMIPVWAINGLAQAMLWPPIVRILSDHLDHEQYVRANLIVTTAAHVSTILLYIYAPICLDYFGWEAAFISATALALVVLVVFLLAISRILPARSSAIPRSGAKTKAANTASHSIGAILLRSGILPIFGCIVMCGFLRDGIESWLPTLYAEAFNRPAGEATLVSVLLPIFSVGSITLVTAVHKKKFFNNEIRGSAVLFLLAAVLCVPLTLLIEMDFTVTRFICLILAALVCAAMHGINFLLISCLPGRFARFGRASTVGGLVNAFVYIGAAASMYGIALIAENFSWMYTTMSWIAIAAIGVVLALIAYRKYTAFIKQTD